MSTLVQGLPLRYFEKRFAACLVFICLPLLFLPKINLLRFESETAGIRIDDIVLFLFAMLLFWAHFLLEKRIFRIESIVFIIFFYSLISFMLNSILVYADILPVKAKIFYCVRLFEYFLFFYVGALTSRFFSISSIMAYFFLWNFSIILLQKAGLVGAITSGGYTSNSSWRVSGIASFPNEMGILLNLIYCFFAFKKQEKFQLAIFVHPFWKKMMRHVMLCGTFLLFAILVIWTGSRIGLIALIIPFLGRLTSLISSKKHRALFSTLLFSPILVAVIAKVVMSTSSMLGRSAGLLDIRANMEIISIAWARIDPNNMSWEMAINTEADVSWWMRIHKWCHALKLYVTHPECYLFGIGPGFSTAALDGGLLRILVEYGIIGVFLFYKLFSTISKVNAELKWMVIALLINMIFIDGYLAYKPMSLLFFTVGYYAAKPRERASPS